MVVFLSENLLPFYRTKNEEEIEMGFHNICKAWAFAISYRRCTWDHTELHDSSILHSGRT